MFWVLVSSYHQILKAEKKYQHKLLNRKNKQLRLDLKYTLANWHGTQYWRLGRWCSFPAGWFFRFHVNSQQKSEILSSYTLQLGYGSIIGGEVFGSPWNCLSGVSVKNQSAEPRDSEFPTQKREIRIPGWLSVDKVGVEPSLVENVLWS